MREQYPKPFSLAFCLEDTVSEAVVEDAEKELFRILEQISSNLAVKSFYLPLIFIRIRSPQQLKSLAALYHPFSHVLRGFILPKFFIENCADYIRTIQELSVSYPDYYYMPIF